MNSAVLTLMSLLTLECGDHNKAVKNGISLKPNKVKIGAQLSKNTEFQDTLIAKITNKPNDVRKVKRVILSAEVDSQNSKHQETQTNSTIKLEIAKTSIHVTWNTLLSKYVNHSGDVNYKGFLTDKKRLQAYLDHLAKNSPERIWSKNKKLAYYINLYNAATVKLIVDNYPTKSIKDIKKPWGKRWIKTGDGILSLGDIEHKILRKMKEPRIHFAINCASYSCPKLMNNAFTASQMEIQLQQATIGFINDRTRNKIASEKLQLSNIFKWHKKDFTENGSLVDYIKLYTPIEISTNADINYLNYNWSLNDIK